MGTPWFYIEFLTTWCSLLRSHHGFRNPAVFAVEYSLAPEKVWPTQIMEAKKALDYVVDRVHGRRERIVVAGDSAGGALALDLLYSMRDKVGYAVLISPWVEIAGAAARRKRRGGNGGRESRRSAADTATLEKSGTDTGGDYLELQRLEELGLLYSGRADPSKVSPGEWQELEAWARGMPWRGIGIYYAEHEVLGVGVRRMVGRLRQVGGPVKERRIGGVHAWAVAAMFLGHDWEERSAGIQLLCADVEKALRAEAFGAK